jgi:glycosyltransferase involved in cell wall biosynthesis
VHACVVIPCFDHPRTVEAVVRGALEHCPSVVVVDDGSREAVPRLPGARVVRHERNRGKGAALLTGFRLARESGCTHAITLDADGQHLPGDIPRLLEAARAEPGALVLGARDLRAAGAPRGSRAGLANSNFWTWVETGLRLPDTQTGFRCYPLEAIDKLRLTTSGYDLEIEVLIKAAWAGVPVASVPVGVLYAPDRVSHLRPFLDFLRIGRLNARLVFLRICLPAPFLAILVQRRFHEMSLRRRARESFAELFLREPGSSRRIALSAALGFFMGIAPIWGFQIAATLVAAHVTRLSKSVAVVASHISIPVFVPAILYLSLLLGRWALGRRTTTLDLAPTDLPAWIAGSFLLAAIASVVGGLVVYLLVAGARRVRKGAA